MLFRHVSNPKERMEREYGHMDRFSLKQNLKGFKKT